MAQSWVPPYRGLKCAMPDLWHPGDLSSHKRWDPAQTGLLPQVQGTARSGRAHLKAVSSTFSCSLVASSGMRDRWEICVAAQPNWKMMMKGR